MPLSAAQRIVRDTATLSRREPRMARRGQPLSVEVWGGGYGSLVRLILGQLVSIEAADAMWRNLRSALGEVSPATIVSADPALLRRCGFTARKAENARRIGAAGVDFVDLDRATDVEIVAALDDLPGVGRWTAECYLLFALGRRDVFPAGDLGLRVGWQEIARLRSTPSEGELRERAEAWSPYRTAASYLIWARYLARRGRA